MDYASDKPRACVSELVISCDDQLESDEFEDNRQQQDVFEKSRSLIDQSVNGESPILGRHFKMPDLSTSFDPDPPRLDSTLAYIPVYTHLKTYDLAPIERPKTPPFVKMIRAGRTMAPRNLIGSPFHPKTEETDDRNMDTMIDSGRSMKSFEKNRKTPKNV